MKQADIIANKIKRFRVGYVFTPSCFYEDVNNPVIVSRILGEMVKAGKIRRIAKGKFDKPIKSVLGAMPPSTDWLTRNYLFDGKSQIGYLTGTNVFAEIGLTTQISSMTEIGSNTYRRAIEINGYKIRFILQKNTINSENIQLLQLLDAIRFIKQIPATTANDAVVAIIGLIRAKDSFAREKLQQLAMNYTPCVRALTGAIIESIGDDASVLFKSLNPVSKYNLGVSDKTLNLVKWRIV